jgi:toxin YoeB
MIICWSTHAWDDYLHWQQNDKKKLKRINQLIKDIMRNPFSGIGEPEPLRHNWTGYWSRRIDREHRIVYKYEDEKMQIVKCRFHY